MWNKDKQIISEAGWVSIFPAGQTYAWNHVIDLDPCSNLWLCYSIKDYLTEDQGLFCIRSANYGGEVSFLENYFLDPLNPSEPENQLFMLEHNLDYKSRIDSAKRAKK